MRILSEAMMNDPMMTQNLQDLFNEENLAELSAMVRRLSICIRNLTVCSLWLGYFQTSVFPFRIEINFAFSLAG